MQLYLIRHAQSGNNLLYERTGESVGRDMDPELTDYGRKQIEHVADFLVTGRGGTPVTRDAQAQNIDGFGITHVYSSLMVRAMDTAAAIARKLDITPVARDDVYEMGGIWLGEAKTGAWIGQPGRNRAFFADRFPQFVLPDWPPEEGWWNRPAEDKAACFQRAHRFWARLHEQHGGTGDKVVVVTHGMFYNMALRALLNLPPEPGFWFAINNVAITRFIFRPDEFIIAYQNRTDFLPPELVT